MDFWGSLRGTSYCFKPSMYSILHLPLGSGQASWIQQNIILSPMWTCSTDRKTCISALRQAATVWKHIAVRKHWLSDFCIIRNLWIQPSVPQSSFCCHRCNAPGVWAPVVVAWPGWAPVSRLFTAHKGLNKFPTQRNLKSASIRLLGQQIHA